MTTTTPYRVLSWGCGLQSTTLAAMSALGELDRLDLVITADTGWERQVTYDIRAWYTAWLQEHGLTVHVVQFGDIRVQGAQKSIHIPFWTDSGGPLKRECTREYKIRPIRRHIRETLGYDRSKPPHPPPGTVELWLGITMDEWTRAKPSRVQYITARFPFLGLKWTRDECTTWLQEHGLPVPPKSACVCCPYRRASEWIEIRAQSPEEWRAAIAFDEANRNNPLAARNGSTADELYIWRDSIPLAEADLEFVAAKERRLYRQQLPLFACESGYCGV